MSPCNVVRYRRLNRKDARLQVFGAQFCAECPDVDAIPAACDASCDPGAEQFGECPYTARCPCAREDSEARKRAFAVWLMARLETLRLRERAREEGSPDGRTAVVWRSLAQLLLDAISAEEQHQALARWSAAVLAEGGAREVQHLAALLPWPAQPGQAQQGGEAPGGALRMALTERQQWALRRARLCSQVDSLDIAKQFGVSRELGRQDLVLLMQLGLLVRRGTGKGTVYELAGGEARGVT